MQKKKVGWSYVEAKVAGAGWLAPFKNDAKITNNFRIGERVKGL